MHKDRYVKSKSCVSRRSVPEPMNYCTKERRSYIYSVLGYEQLHIFELDAL